MESAPNRANPADPARLTARPVEPLLRPGRWLATAVVLLMIVWLAFGLVSTITPDHDFLIDRVGPIAVLGGFSGPAFKHVPAIGEMATALVLDGVPAPTRFSLARRYVAR